MSSPGHKALTRWPEPGYQRHEHLYEEISRNVIPSGAFKDTTLENAVLLAGARVILCTISMLSTCRLVVCGFTKIVPVQTVIIDEASQIEAGDYLSIFAKYKATLRKMVFIGDDKQCECEGWGGWNRGVLTVGSQWPHTDKKTSRN